MSHTKGPWFFKSGTSKGGDSCDLLVAELGTAADGEEPEYVEVLFGMELSDGERSANWILASLAPRLLEACKAVQPYLLAGHDELHALLESVIAEAEGRS